MRGLLRSAPVPRFVGLCRSALGRHQMVSFQWSRSQLVMCSTVSARSLSVEFGSSRHVAKALPTPALSTGGVSVWGSTHHVMPSSGKAGGVLIGGDGSAW